MIYTASFKLNDVLNSQDVRNNGNLGGSGVGDHWPERWRLSGDSSTPSPASPESQVLLSMWSCCLPGWSWSKELTAGPGAHGSRPSQHLGQHSRHKVKVPESLGNKKMVYTKALPKWPAPLQRKGIDKNINHVVLLIRDFTQKGSFENL